MARLASLSACLRLRVSLLSYSFFPRHTRVILRENNVFAHWARSVDSRPILKRLLKRVPPRADAVICQSEYMREDLGQAWDLPREKLVRIYNGTDVDNVSTAAESQSPFANTGPGPHVVSVGRLVRQKGHDRLVAAFPALQGIEPENIVDPAVKIVQVVYSQGWGQDQQGGALLYFAQDECDGYYWYGLVFSGTNFE